MKNEMFPLPNEAAPVSGKNFKLTYGEVLDQVRERRLAELEESNPGEDKRNQNLAILFEDFVPS